MDQNDTRNPAHKHSEPSEVSDAGPNPKGSVEKQSASHRAIEKRAYYIYLASGCQDGNCEKNWFQAERELEQKEAQEDRARAKMIYEGSPVFEIDPANPG